MLDFFSLALIVFEKNWLNLFWTIVPIFSKTIRAREKDPTYFISKDQNSLLPKNSTPDFIQSVLSEEEITIDLFRNLPKQWSVSGSYRKLFIKPENLNWSWIPYKDPNKTLIETDLNLINKSKSLETESEPETNEKQTEK
jgi:hypothetical protein